MQLRRSFMLIGIGAVIATTVIGILAVLVGNEFGSFQQKCLVTTIIVAYFGWLTFAALPKEGERGAVFAVIAIVTALIAGYYILREVWFDVGWESGGFIAKLTLTSLAVGIANAWISQLWRTATEHVVVKGTVYAALFGVVLVTGLCVSVVWTQNERWLDFLGEHWRPVLALTILSVGGSIALPFLTRLTRQIQTVA